MGALCLAEGICLFTGKDFLMFMAVSYTHLSGSFFHPSDSSNNKLGTEFFCFGKVFTSCIRFFKEMCIRDR